MRKDAEKVVNDVNDIELIKISIEEFSRIQQYMLLSEKKSRAYETMKIRYIELKTILTASSVNLTELDIIKE